MYPVITLIITIIGVPLLHFSLKWVIRWFKYKRLLSKVTAHREIGLGALLEASNVFKLSQTLAKTQVESKEKGGVHGLGKVTLVPGMAPIKSFKKFEKNTEHKFFYHF